MGNPGDGLLGGIALLSAAFLAGASSLAAAAAASAVSPAVPPPRTTLRENARVTLRTATLRIDPMPGAGSTDCAALGLADLDVKLRGRRLEPESLIDLERRQVPTLHAILIDTSASMVGKLGFVRDAAAAYVRNLRPGLDRALVATFDESTVLVQAPTGDRRSLLAGIERVRMGHATSLHDGLYHVIDELIVQPERPVVVLLTDGVDTASLYERDDVNALVDRRPDLVVFAIGYALPDIHAGRAGVSSAKRFLQNLARRTGGEFFDVPTASRLDRAYLRVRQRLAGEAVLMLTDPEPGAPRGRVTVRSKLPACRVTVFRERPDSSVPDARPPAPGPGTRQPLPPGAPVRARYGLPGSTDVPESCGGTLDRDLPDGACFVEARPGRISGCALDVAMDGGMLYSTLDVSRWEINDGIELRIRPFEIAVPELADLPDGPVAVLDSLAEHVFSVAGAEGGADARKQPAELHAGPFVDFPTLINGRTFLDARSALAAALFRYPEYRKRVQAQLAKETERQLAAFSESLRRVAPHLPRAELARIVDASVTGQRIHRRGQIVSEEDVQRYLGAWLGDVSAHDLFAKWEVRHANRLLAGEESVEPFLEAWKTLRRVFFVPSYARILTLLYPVQDRADGRIGFWRVVLPRVSWLLPRVQASEHHPEFSDLPLDLVPDVPLGLLALVTQQSHDPGLGRWLRSRAYRVISMRYQLSGKPYKRDPPRAFREVRVTVDLLASSDDPTDLVRLVADMRIDPDAHTVSIARCEWKGALAEGLPACVASVRDDTRSAIRTGRSGGVEPQPPDPAH